MRPSPPRSLALAAWLAASACDASGLAPPVVEADADADADTDTDADADADADTDTDTDTDTNPPGPICQNDGYEPNDTPAQATTYAFPLAGLVLDGNDLDLFGAQVQPGATLEVRIDFAHALGDIDLRLLSATGTVLGASTSTSNQERIVWQNTGSSLATVFAEADLLGTGCNTYGLTMNQNTGGGGCADDVFEPNDSPNVAASATSPLFNLVLDSQGSNLDYFAVQLGPGDQLFADAYFTDADGDIDLYVTNASGSNLVSSATTTDNESVSYTNTSGSSQTVYLRTRLFGQGCTDYDLTWTVIAAGPVCSDDTWEPNDDVNSAPFDPPSPLNGLVLNGAGSSSDWFNIFLAPEEELVVDLAFTHANGDIDLQIRDRAGAVLASSTTSTNNESTSWKNTTGNWTEVFIRAWLFGQQANTCTTYSLTYDILPAPFVCVDDTYEDNDSTATPIPLLNIPVGGSKTYSLIADDDDWFAVQALPFEDVSFTTTSTAGDVDLYLYDVNLNLLQSSAGVSATETVRWSSLFGGLAVLEVRHWSGECAPYTLVVDSSF